MSYRDWEQDVEFYEDVEGQLVRRLDASFKELPFSKFDTQDSVVTYRSSREREVYMRILGFTSLNPMVIAHVTTPGGAEKIRRGELIGSQHPEEDIIIPGVLRTRHLPIIHETGQSGGQSALPTPKSRLRARRPRR